MKYAGLFATLCLAVGFVSATAQAAGGAPIQLPTHRLPVLLPAEGERQEARLYLPQPEFRADHPRPLIVSLHGYSGHPDMQMTMFPFVEGAAANDALLLLPSGLEDRTGRRFWNATDFCCDFFWKNPDDVTYLAGLIEKMIAEYGADPARVFVLGHSNGGFMANRLACERPDLLAGIVSVSGGTYKKPEKCKNPQPMHFLQLHAVNDSIVRFDGNGLYAGATGSLDFWRNLNQCEAERRVGPPQDFVDRIPGNDTEEESWTCQTGASVKLWKIGEFKESGYNPHVPGFTPASTEALLKHMLSLRKL